MYEKYSAYHRSNSAEENRIFSFHTNFTFSALIRELEERSKYLSTLHHSKVIHNNFRKYFPVIRLYIYYKPIWRAETRIKVALHLCDILLKHASCEFYLCTMYSLYGTICAWRKITLDRLLFNTIFFNSSIHEKYILYNN